jgi:OOP family OmpA-OmpF porin
MKQIVIVVLGIMSLSVGCGGGQASVEEPQGEAEGEAAGSPAAEVDAGAAELESVEPEPEPEASTPEPSADSQEGDVKEASEARITDRNIVISGKVLFETGKAKLKKVSFAVLDEVVRAIEKHPEIIKLQVVGHTDSDGDAKANKRLSKRRATSVMNYLIKKGIERDRLSAVGMGEDAPIASNDTEEGKDKNRRVEFVIVERAEVRAVTHTSSSATSGKTKSRKASNDEVEELIKKEGLEKDLH